MDYMDIDEGCNIPDTPDRLAAQNVNGRWCIEKESDSSEVSHSGNTELFREGARNQLRDRSELVLDNGQSKTLSFFSGKDLSVPNKSEGEGDFSTSLGNSFSSKNACLFRRTAAEKTANHEDKYSLHSQSTGKGKALSTPQSHTCGEGAVADLREWSGPAKVFCNDFPNGASEDCQAMEIRDGSISTNGFSSFGGIANSSMTALNTCKGKGKINDTGKGASGLDHGKGTFGDSQPKFGKSTSSLCYSNPSPRVGQNFFVRNGCISPHNIAKAKQLAENHCNGSMDVQNDRVTISDCNLIRDLIAEDSNDNRRQGVIIHPSPREPNAKTIDLATRSSVTPNEETCGTGNASGDAFICFEGSGGWRNTPSCTKKINLPLSHEGRHLSWTKDDPCYVNQQNENMGVRRESWTGSSSRTDNDYHEDQNTASFQLGSALTEDQVVSRPMSESVHLSGRRSAATTLVKRQKQGSASSNHGESSTLASVHSDIAFLGSSGEPLNSRSTCHQSVHAPRILDPVIEIDESSPEMRLSGSPNTGRSSNDESDDRARQVEADEMLARELQEQLYNEAPGVEDDEWEETSHHAYSSGSHPVFHPSGSSASDFYRQPPLWSSQNHSSRRGTNARGPASARLTRLRSRLPSQLPRLSRESGSIFPPSMDLDMRMHILEALEDFSDMEMAGNFHQAEREFNENDYEMLLALDENNHQHRGASPTQINSLPQSTVQGDNFEEACAICLETPTSGDTIRHLPCLHKFHKDCIDQWLRMRTSCPVCKSSIT